jgi:hypothetical protein
MAITGSPTSGSFSRRMASATSSGLASGTDASSAGLNGNHVRHVVATLRSVDELLSRAEDIMASAGAPSLFPDHAPDATPLQRKVAHDHILRIRATMRSVLEDLGIPPPAPISGALWAARVALTRARIEVADIASRSLRGYGRLSDDAARMMDGIGAELRAALDRLESFLAQGTGTDLEARLRRLERTSNGVALLRELERVIATHGLVEFRNAVVLLLERLEAPSFEIGVFGRVSSGKSSLLNHLLGGAYLPVGVTPVTAVPTRIRHGPRARAVVEFADARPRTIALAVLPEFATEQQNPGNEKHVTRIRLEVPAARLREGIELVDTPGLGSLASAGADETIAYLPRCDLGLVLVDSVSTLTH